MFTPGLLVIRAIISSFTLYSTILIGDWNSAAYESEKFGGSGRQAEPYFQQLAVKERAKFEEETSSVAMIKSDATSSNPTQVGVWIYGVKMLCSCCRW